MKKLVEETRKRESDAAAAHLKSVQDGHAVHSEKDTLYQNLQTKIVPAVKKLHDDLALAKTQREAELQAAELARASL